MGKMNQAEKRGTKANELWTHFLSLECIAYVCLYSLDVRDKYACMKKAVLPSSSEMIETPQPKNTALLHRYLGWLWRISLLKSTQKKQVIFCLGLPRSRPGKKCQHNIRRNLSLNHYVSLGSSPWKVSLHPGQHIAFLEGLQKWAVEKICGAERLLNDYGRSK